MYVTPEATYPIDPHLHPLSPERLLRLPPDNHSLSISPYLAAACDAWYERLLSEVPHIGLHPDVVRANNERTFAHLVHTVVQKNVAYDINHRPHPTIDKTQTSRQLEAYYYNFSPLEPDKRIVRRQYQESMIPNALKHREKFHEVNVVLGLQRAFVAKRQQAPSRATFALLSTYGFVLLNSFRADEAEDTTAY